MIPTKSGKQFARLVEEWGYVIPIKDGVYYDVMADVFYVRTKDGAKPSQITRHPFISRKRP